MNRYIWFFSVIGAVALLAVSFTVLATSKDDIVYPVAELGGCENEQECRAYCDDSVNLNVCLAFTEAHNLLSDSELEKARKFESVGAIGPGGCTTERECETYCENVNNIQECLAFAEQHGFMEEEELQEARKVAAALEQGAVLPGGCQSKAQCEVYCEDPNNMRECIAFAEQAGFMSPEELREAKQVLKALDAGVPLPGNCRGEKECETYCEDPAHMEECVEFGIAAGFIPPEEAEEVRRILPLMKEGKMPGGCREREECEAYCAQPENTEECTTFFIQAGFMTPEEAELFAKTGGKGPGGCSGERECEQFCNNPANQQACFEFAKEHGLVPEEELASIEQGVGQLKEALETAPPEVAQCLREQLGPKVAEGIRAGTFLPGPDIGDKMRACFELQEEIVKNQMRECLSKSCDEFFVCIESVGGGGPGGPGGPPPEGEHGPEGGGSGFFDPEIEAKIEQCIQEQFEGEEGFGPPPGFEGEFEQEFGDFKDFEGESREEFDRKFQEEFERKQQEEFERRQEEFAPGDIPHEEQFFEQQGLEQFEGLIPQVPPQGPSPEEIQRIEEQRRQEEQLRQEEEQRHQIEQELQQQFEQQFHQETSSPEYHEQPPEGGSAIEAFLYLLRPLLPR